jgi:O-antigen/teichoic acid export membrane protein
VSSFTARLIRTALAFTSPALRRRLLAAAGWNLIGSLVGRGVVVLGMMAVARLLGPGDFGALTMIYSTALMFEAVATVGLTIPATKFTAELRATNPERAGRVIAFCSRMAAAFGAVVALALAVAAPWLAAAALAAPHLTDELRLCALLLLFSTWAAAQAGSLVGLEAFRILACASAMTGTGTVVLLVAGAAAGGSVGAVVGLVAGSMLGATVHHLALRRAMRKAELAWVSAFPKEEFALLWRFSLPALLGDALWMPANWAANAILANTPDGYAELGVLGVAMQWFALLMFLPIVLTRVMLPLFAERIGGDAQSQAADLARGTAGVLVVVMTPLAAMVALASPAIMALYGGAYRDGAPALALMAMAAAAAAPQGVLESYVAAKGRMWPRSTFNLLWALITVSGAALLAGLGAVGVAASILSAYTIRTGLTFLYFRHLSRQSR